MMRNSGVRSGLILIGVSIWLSVGVSQFAAAGLLFPNALAIPGSSGTVPLIDMNTATHYGDVEHAVFTAANFATFTALNGFGFQDTPNLGVTAGEFVYAYQVYNIGAQDIVQFSAGLADVGPPLNPMHHGDGMDDPESVNSGDQDFIMGTGQDPNSSSVSASAVHGAASGSSVRFNFAGPMPARINSGEASSILFYTSPWAPRWDNGSTTTGAGQSRIPGPEEGRTQPFIPEPSSLALALVALLPISIRRSGR
jgi:hypothetical protein